MCGAGFGFFQSPNNHMLLSSAPNHRAGSAGGMLATARLVGQSTGAALVALFFHLFGDGAPHDAMLLAGPSAEPPHLSPVSVSANLCNRTCCRACITHY